ncbi:hypothetical protein D9M72_535000 [compost metagenome]
MAARGKLAGQLDKGAHLGAFGQLPAEFRRDQARIARGAPQPHQLRQHVDARLRLVLGLRQGARTGPCRRAFGGLACRFHARQRGLGLGLGLAAQGLVVRGFDRLGLDPDHQLRARRQFIQHLRLGPAQHERRDHAAQPLARLAHAAALDRVGKVFVEAGQ